MFIVVAVIAAEPPIIKHNIIANDMHSVLMMNLFFRAILGIEYNIPIATSIIVMIILLRLSVDIEKMIPNPLVIMTNIAA